MRKVLAIILMFTIIFIAVGCHRQEKSTENLIFYYCAKTVDFNEENGVLIGENRNKSEIGTDLTKIIESYIAGPISDTLYCPISKNVTVQNIQHKDDTVEILFSTNFSNLTGLDLSIACVGIGKTILSCTDTQNVKIQAENARLDGENAITVTNENVLLLDEMR